jgi:excisionase family DNA binding protein
LRKKEVAEILAVSTRTVDRMAAKGTLKKYYIRGIVRFEAAQVAQLIQRQCQ